MEMVRISTISTSTELSNDIPMYLKIKVCLTPTINGSTQCYHAWHTDVYLCCNLLNYLYRKLFLILSMTHLCHRDLNTAGVITRDTNILQYLPGINLPWMSFGFDLMYWRHEVWLETGISTQLSQSGSAFSASQNYFLASHDSPICVSISHNTFLFHQLCFRVPSGQLTLQLRSLWDKGLAQVPTARAINPSNPHSRHHPGMAPCQIALYAYRQGVFKRGTLFTIQLKSFSENYFPPRCWWWASLGF